MSSRTGSSSRSADVLQQLLANPLDAGYAEAAQRRAAAGVPPQRASWGLRALTAIGALVVGVLLAVAYKEQTRLAPSQSDAHRRLVDQVRTAQDRNETLLSEAAQLAAQVRKLREAAANPADRAALSDLEIASGDRAARGPGVVVRLADVAPPSTSATPGPSRSVPGSYPQNLIGDRELRDVVNELWAAGAEAIAVNGIRLSATSAIRFAGQVVLIDFQPVTSPYTVEAIGNANGLDVAFVSSEVGSRLQTLDSAGRIEFEIRTSDNLSVPASAQADPVHAQPLPPQPVQTLPNTTPSGQDPSDSGSPPTTDEPTNEGTR